MRVVPALLLLLAACGGDGRDRTPTGDGGGGLDAGIDAAPTTDAGSGAPCEDLPHDWIGEALPDVVAKSNVRIALGPEGVPSVAFLGPTPGERSSAEDVLYVASRDDGWSPSLVARDTRSLRGVGLGITPDGTPHVVFGRSLSTSFRAELIDGTWATQALAGDRPADVSQVAVTSGGDPWIVHDGDLYGLYFVWRDGDAWSEEVIDDGTEEGGMRSVGLHNSLAIDASGRAHVAHVAFSTNELFYAVGEPGAWTKHTVDDSVDEERTSLVVGSSGVVHIAYQDEDAIAVATGNDAAWSVETVVAADGPRAPRLALSAGGVRHLLYRALEAGELRWAEDSTGEWMTRTLAPVQGQGYDLVADAEGRLHAAWIAPETSGICYASVSAP